MQSMRERYVLSRVPRRPALAAVFAILSLLFSGLVVVTPWTEPVPAQAAALAACDGTSTQNGLTLAPNHGKVLYIDTGVSPKLDAAYAGYRVTTAAGSPRTNIWVSVSSFSGGAVVLANAADSDQQISSLAGGATTSTYFLVKALRSATVPQSHVVRVYQDRPGTDSATVLYECLFSFSQVQETIKASPNKVLAITVDDSSPELGQLITIKVWGETGNIGQGKSPDFDIVWMSPAAYSTWPTRALRLESTSATFGNTFGNNFQANNPPSSVSGSTKSYTNQLLVSSARSNSQVGTSNSGYILEYRFRVIGSTNGPVPIAPVSQISSGKMIKHTDLSAVPSVNVQVKSGDNAMFVSKTVTSTTGLTTSRVGDDTYVEVPYKVTVSSTSSVTTTVDEIIDTPATGAMIKNGSVAIKDVTRASSTAISDPTLLDSEAALSPRPQHFTGPFSVRSGLPAELTYTMLIPCTPGEYANAAYGRSGDSRVGATASVDPRTTTTVNSGCGLTTRDDTVAVPPEATTQPAAAVGTTSATLNGLVDGNDNNPATSFHIGTSPTLATYTTVAGSPATATGSSPSAISATPTLVSGTTYYYRVVATTGSQIVSGNILSFVTNEVTGVPTAITESPTGVATGTATLIGTIDPNQTATGALFELWQDDSLGSPDATITVTDEGTSNGTPSSFTGAYATQVSMDRSVTAGKQYWYRAVATYNSGANRVEGNLVTFRAGATQSISFSEISNRSLSSGTFNVSPTATPSGLPVTLESGSPGVCTATSTGAGDYSITLGSAGTCVLVATQAGGTSGGTAYASADPVTRTFEAVETLQITTASLTSGSKDVIYGPLTLQATGGSNSYVKWEITSGQLPAGLTLSATSGALSGTPTATVTSTPLTVQVTDSLGFTADKAFTLTVVDAPTITTLSPLTAGSRNVAYAGVTLAASGGSGTYSSWTVTSGSLPAGLALTTGSGVISGTPTASGTSTFTVRVTDSLGGTATKEFNLTVHDPPTITTSSLPGAQTSTAYQQTVSASGGVAPYSWSKQSGDLPPGVTLTDDSLSGTPTSAGTYTFTVKVTDSLGGTDTQSLSIVVSGPLSIQTLTLADGAVNESYSQTIEAAGGTAPYSQWSVSAGALPGGLTLSSQGVLSGTPTTEGSSTFTVQVRDAANSTATRQYTVAIAGAPDATTLDDSSATTVSAVFKGRINPKGGSNTSTSFEYSRVSDLSSGVVTVPGRSGLSGNAAIDEEVTVNGLTPYTLYYYRIKASNARGTAMGAIKSLRTSPGSPLATTDDSSSVTSSGAVLTGTVRARGPLAQIRFDYSTTLDLSSGVTTATSATTATDNADTPGSVTLTGLEPYTTYYFRTRGTSDYGDDTGVIKSFRTDPGTPIATTDDSIVDDEEATLFGKVKARGPNATIHFDYSTDANFPVGSTTTINSARSATGNTDTDDSTTITGLTPNTTYYYRVRGSSSAGSNTGATRSFTTLPAHPLAYTDDTSALSSTGVTLNGRVNGRGNNAQIWFQLADDTDFTAGVRSWQSSKVAGGNSDTTDDTSISGLQPYMTYYYRVLGKSSNGDDTGVTRSFRTLPDSPLATTDDTGAVDSTTAVLRGTVKARGPEAAFHFDLSKDDSTFGNSADDTTVIGNVTATDNTDTPDSVTVTGLEPYTTYYYRVRGVSQAHGSGTGGIKSFRTGPGKPVATTLDDSSVIDDTTIQVRGNVRARGAATTVVYEYRRGNPDLGTPDGTASAASVGPDGDQTESISIPGLRPGNTYYYRVRGSNTQGTAHGTVKSIRIPPGRPKATTMAPVTVTSTTAVIEGSVNAWGGSNGKARFRWSESSFVSGASTNRVSRAVFTRAAQETSDVTVTGTDDSATTYTLTGLTPSTTYYYEVRITTTRDSGDDTANGGVMSFTTAAANSPTIDTAATPDGTAGRSYSLTFVASGGSGTYTNWAISAGALPAGLNLNGTSGALTGTPSAAGTSNFTVRVTDSANATATRSYTLVVRATPSITTASLASGTVGIAYSATVVATGGTSPLTWSLVAPNNTLPAGLTWDAATQRISGTPTADGSTNVDVRVTDANGATDTKSYTIVIAAAAAPTITTASLPDGTIGTNYSASVAASGGTTPYTWSMVAPDNVLPGGLTWNAGSRTISGTPTAAGTTSLTFRVTDAHAQIDTKTLTITITTSTGGGGLQSQVITFPRPDDRFIDESPLTLEATASSGLPVRYTTSTPDVCALTGTSADLVAPGTCRLTAHQDGDGTWSPANSVTRSFDIRKRPQVIDLPGIRAQLLTPIRFPVEVTNSDATSSRRARSIGGRLPDTTITLTSVTPQVCRVTADIISLRAVGDCTLHAYSAGSDVYLEAERDLTFPVTEADLLSAVEPKPIVVPAPPLPVGWTYTVDDTPAGVSEVTFEDDRVLVTPMPGATGISTVRISAATAGREPVTSDVTVTFRPRGPGVGTFTPTAANKTTFTWRPTPTSSVTGYEVTVDGRLACRAVATTCEGSLLVGPGSEVRVLALGGQGVRSDSRRLTYLSAEPVLVTTIYFDSDKDTLDRQAKKRLGKLAKIIREEAFRRLLVEGHTDSVSSEGYNKRLSQRRIDSAVGFLQRRLRDLNISERALGELFPADSNATPGGRAMNRRVEISVW